MAWATKILSLEKVQKIREQHRIFAEEVGAVFTRRIERLDRLLSKVAVRAPVRAGASPSVLYVAWVSTYSSQGFGANSYARNAAEAYADVARGENIPVEVSPSKKGGGDYEVLVWVESPLDVEILRLKPGPSLREQIRLCWARGVNPRVYNPYLPVGIEAKLGIDCQGRYL